MSTYAITVAVLCFGIVIMKGAAEKYTTKWDNINVVEILESDRLLKNYFKCLNNEGSCTPEGAELKRNLPDALKSGCSKCSEKQKSNTDTVIDFLIEKRPEMWDTLQEKYDPDHTYFNKHYQATTTTPSTA